MAREQRVFSACQVEFERLGSRVRGTSQDISRHGLFVRTTEFLPVGDVRELFIHVPSGKVVSLIARVAHILSEQGARALGRQPGMGFEFLELDPERLARLNAYLDSLIDEPRRELENPMRQIRVVVGEGSTRLLERLTNALGEGGFTVDAAQSGAEAYSACLGAAPDLLLIADDMPVMDGWTLIQMLVARPRAPEIAIVLMSEDASDITRLKAYRMGVRDFIHKPFTDEELVIRLRHLVSPSARPDSDRVGLKGSLGEIGVGTLLSLLDFERKSGILAVIADHGVARIFVASGRIVKVDTPSTLGAEPVPRLMKILDWNKGSFEFIACEVVGKDEIGLPTQHLLLEHARLRDEEHR